MITEHIFAWHFKKVPRRSDARHRRSSSSMRADDESQKNGETKRTFASRRATASLAISSPFATLFFFFRLDATRVPIQPIGKFPLPKKGTRRRRGSSLGPMSSRVERGVERIRASMMRVRRSESRPFPSAVVVFGGASRVVRF